MQFTWFATAWDNDDLAHWLGMLSAMLIVIVLAAGIPRVYEGNDRLFVFAYAGMQAVLVLMFARVLPHAGEARGFARAPDGRRDRRAGDALVDARGGADEVLGLGARAVAPARRPPSRCARSRARRSMPGTYRSATGCSRSSCSARA